MSALRSVLLTCASSSLAVLWAGCPTYPDRCEQTRCPATTVCIDVAEDVQCVCDAYHEPAGELPTDAGCAEPE